MKRKKNEGEKREGKKEGEKRKGKNWKIKTVYGRRKEIEEKGNKERKTGRTTV